MRTVQMFLFFVLPALVIAISVIKMSPKEKRAAADAASMIQGRHHTLKIDCGRGREPRVMPVFGRSREEAIARIKQQVPKCSVTATGAVSDPLWQQALEKRL
ncbi:MAG: hypothetical protein AAFR04_16250 [Pseudomonadota bacterium]